MFKGEIVTTVPNDQKTCFINVDSYDGKQLRGTIYNPYYKCSKNYESLTDLLMLMDRLFDELFGAQPESEMRTFRSTMKLNSWRENAQLLVEDSGKLATFKVDVLFRQRASWQGVICWMEKNREECFRSVLELITLMDSALSAPPKVRLPEVSAKGAE